MNKYCFDNLPEELKAGTEKILPLLDIETSADGVKVTAVKNGTPSLTKTADGVVIGYNKKCEYFRMLGMLNSSLVGDNYSETPRQDLLCYMADQSRNAVLTMDAAKRMVMYLASIGFDSVMLYTEDTYEIEGEPYFGYMRGRWTESEIKELVEFSDDFGVEIIPCIQTLAHLERMMRWDCYKPLIDCSNIMVVHDDRVLELIDKMFATCAKCFKSRRINIGLDEAHLLGAGKYLDKNGYKTRYEIMNQHLEDVLKIAKKYGFELMMWSDMFFRIAFGGAYYSLKGEIPQDIMDKVPQDITLIYWDYYTSDVPLFTHMVDLHKKFKNKSAFAGGAQRWGRFTTVNDFSIKVEDMHIEKCLEKGINSIIATCWGDDGSESATFGVLPTLVLYAEKCYKGDFDENWLNTRIEEIMKIEYTPFHYMHRMDYMPEFNPEDRGASAYSKVLLYSDILTGVYYRHVDRDRCVPYYNDLADKFAPYASNKNFGYMFDVMQKLAKVCALKAELICDIRDSYAKGDKARLCELANKVIPETITAVSALLEAFEKQWKYESRAFGLEVHQTRMGGLKERMNSVANVINDYCNGKVAAIDELEQAPLYADCRTDDSDLPLTLKERSWKSLTSVNII